MQVTLTLHGIEADTEDGGYMAVYWVAEKHEAQALACRLGSEIVIDIPDAQPPDIYSVTIPEEDAKVNTSRGKRSKS